MGAGALWVWLAGPRSERAVCGRRRERSVCRSDLLGSLGCVSECVECVCCVAVWAVPQWRCAAVTVGQLTQWPYVARECGPIRGAQTAESPSRRSRLGLCAEWIWLWHSDWGLSQRCVYGLSQFGQRVWVIRQL